MPYLLDQRGNEVDENGYSRWAVEGWARHGIYPPPLAGSPENPEIVQKVKESRARWQAMSPAEQAQTIAESHGRLDDIDRRLGIDTQPGSTPSRPSTSL